ncbi:MAG: putative lipid II flippase FtsW [Atopobium sp.]|uniref:putative lipid II flippase FtsW n=1 Tax=Atopobium sp. TaxID=1872650 RepID=UPI002A76524F|nr:putative lipid II flippase FtsW [Atopobium sp.]MDY2788121.1 putative lipid II flippase FtsW [Atopobium sp.]
MTLSTCGTSQQSGRDRRTARTTGSQASGQGTARVDATTKRTKNKKPFLERITAGVPARFMEPRLILSLIVAALVVFGLVMIYSASSVKALQSTGDPAYFFKRQLIYATAGTIVAVVLSMVNYHTLRKGLGLAWMISIALLLMTAALGVVTKGAVRWLNIAGFSFQPSEFVKVVVILYAADILYRYFAEQTITFRNFCKEAVLFVVAPIILILAQPDKGTTLILGATIMVMAYLAGAPMRPLLALAALVGLFIVVLILADDYSRARVITMFNPEADPYGAGYQILQGFYAFGSGGFMGAGIGMSRQKYSYLPEAHNDFIFAVVGEETGLIGTVAVILGFCAFLYYGYRIAKNAPDLCGKLIAAGCTSLIIIQLFVNVMGILGLVPMTGKPLPFLSYGGSSIMSTLALVGLILSVSKQSVLPETEFDRRRSQISLADAKTDSTYPDTHGSGVIAVQPRSASRRSVHHEPSSSDAGAQKDSKAGVFFFRPATERLNTSRSQRTGRAQRIDLGPSPAERLRSRRSDSSKDNRRR